MHDAAQAFRYLNIAGFIVLAGVAMLAWRRRRDRAGMWAAVAFGSLGLLELLAFVPDHPGDLVERAIGRVGIALLVLFPFLLFRFTAAFRHARRDVADGILLVTAALLVWTFALPSLPQSGQRWSAGFAAFVALFLLHWTVLSILVAIRLWLAGRGQPSVARRRMRLLAFASAALTVALMFVAFGGSYSAAGLTAQAVGSTSLVAFYLGLAPPAIVRLWWRRPEQSRLEETLASLLSFAQTPAELTARVLAPSAALVGARALAIRDAGGDVVGAWNAPTDDSTRIDLDLPGGSLVVWTSPYAPFFGDEELSLLRTLGALTLMAVDRVRLYEAERDARVALERADEVKTNFVALAAHELRTPMTTVHGFVATLHHLSTELSPLREAQVREALLEQTERMAKLVEQLLDLSRLDADAIPIDPTTLPVRETLEEIVRATAPDPQAVAVDAPDELVARLDRTALERIVGNLVTNAFRYGASPVRVQAERLDHQLHVTVEDGGLGVDPAFVPDLFERFSRSDRARASAAGSGLGLSIARSFARAHGGDLVYEPGEPHGARFRLVLPAVLQPVATLATL